MHVGVQVISPGTDRVTLTTRWSLMQYSYWFSNVKCQLAIYQGEPRHILCFFALSLPTVNCNTTHTPFPEFYLWYFSEKTQALSQTHGQFIYLSVSPLYPEMPLNFMERREKCPEFCFALSLCWRPGWQRSSALNNQLRFSQWHWDVLRGAWKKE